jgi:2,4-dienoyl-CoA reductase-like NADH-dependent reductase (Old Yellow Enzyme family)
MAELFDPITIKNLSLPNRIVVAPMTRMRAGEPGVPTPEMIAYYRRFAEGGAGLIITEGVYTDLFASKGYFGEPGLVTPEQTEGWRKVADAVHAAGGKIGTQLFHTGRASHSKIIGRRPIAPSAIAARGTHASAGQPMEVPEAMTGEMIEAAIQGYADTARRSKEIGMDCVEIHGAHGYLIHQFYYEDSNTRTDQWGGSLENRIRFGVEVAKRVRKEVGPDFPVIYRFSEFRVDDLKYQNPGSLGLFRKLVPALEAAGVDVFHPSTHDGLKNFHDTDKPLAAHVREMTKKPVIAVGKLGEDPAQARRIISSGFADMAAIGKPMIADADWAARVKNSQPLTPFQPTMLGRL